MVQANASRVAFRYQVIKTARALSLSQALAILGLDRKTDQAEAKRVYRALAMRAHPDRGGQPGEMVRVNAAWEVIQGAYAGGLMGQGANKPSAEETYRRVKAVFDRAQAGDLLEIVFDGKSSSSPPSTRRVLVEERDNSLSHTHLYVFPARRNRRSQMGAIMDYGSNKGGGVYFQATLRQQVRRVREMKIVGQM